jgi:hypothetical protein
MALAPGTRLGPYEVLAQIGVGGMAGACRATDAILVQQVANGVLAVAVTYQMAPSAASGLARSLGRD